MGKLAKHTMSSEEFGEGKTALDATPEQLAAALKQLQDGKGSNGGDFKMTGDEADKIQSCFKEPEFRNLFAEYMEEMSDPKHRAESDQYLKQLEREGNVPEGMAMCSEGLCVKARMVDEQKKDKLGDKLFINVTHCKEILAASQEEATDPATGKKGKRWKLPFSLAPQAQVVEDNSGGKVQAWDVAVNSGTFDQHVRTSQRFCDLLIRTAIDDIKSKFNIPVDPESYKVLKKRKYMGGQPVPMNLGKATKVVPPAARKLADNMASSDDGEQVEELSESSAKTSKKSGPADKPGKPAVPKGFLNNKSRTKTKPQIQKGPIEPEFSILHRSDGTQLEDSWKDEGLTDRVQRQSRPTELVVKIALPGLESVASVDLDITERELVLESEVGVVPQYELRVPLPYPVDADSDLSSAKWVSDSQILFVNLPVLPAPEVEQPQYGSMADVPQMIEMIEEEEVEEVEEETSEEEIEEAAVVVEPLAAVPEAAAVEEEQVGESLHEGVTMPKWEFHDNRMNATLVLRYASVPELNVRSGMSKEGMAIQFWCNEAMHSLAINTYAPIIPTWSRVKVSESQIEVILAKAQPGLWERAGKVCSLEDAGVVLAEWPNEAAAAELKLHDEAVAEPKGSNTAQSSSAEPSVEPAAAEQASAQEEDTETKLFNAFTQGTDMSTNFIASAKYEGTRRGFVFTTRNEETGYYRDTAGGAAPALDADEEACPKIEDVEEGEKGEREGQSGWEWLQDARAGSQAGSSASGDTRTIAPSTEADVEEVKKPRFQKQKFEAGFMERPKKGGRSTSSCSNRHHTTEPYKRG